MLCYGPQSSHPGNYQPFLNKTETQSTNIDLVSAAVKQVSGERTVIVNCYLILLL